jgi:hypothetical protein
MNQEPEKISSVITGLIGACLLGLPLLYVAYLVLSFIVSGEACATLDC